MDALMDRIKLIKQMHLRSIGIVKSEKQEKTKRGPYKPRVNRPKDTEAQKQYRRQYEKERRDKVRAQRRCRTCQRESIRVHFLFEGKLVMEKTAKYCPYHWEDKEKRAMMVGKLTVTN